MPQDPFELLAPEVREAARKMGIVVPTPPQEAAISPILAGKNVLLISPTGTGKTEAALMPVFTKLLSQPLTDGIKILYIAPLRALNRDLLVRLEEWGESLRIKITVRHGDTPPSERQAQAKRPPHMLITTPETLQAILPGKLMRRHLRSVEWVIIDEVHELLDDKRGAQLTVALERLEALAGEFQRIGLSATIGAPEVAGGFIGGVHRVEVIDVGGKKELKIKVESVAPNPQDFKTAEEVAVDPTTAARLRLLRQLLAGGSTLLFTNTRETAEFLGSKLRMLGLSADVAVHHGSLAAEARIEAERRFRSGDVKCVICTSSMELGIDIGAISFVAQYSSPRQVVRLVQRVGRSGHRLGLPSTGVVLAVSPDDAAEAAVISRRALGGELESPVFHKCPLDVLAHQLVGISLDLGSVKIADALSLLRKAYPYREVGEKVVEEVLAYLAEVGLISLQQGTFKARKRGYEYYFSNLSMIPDVRHYTIRDVVSGRNVGRLDETFVAEYVAEEETFICKGETWRVLEIDREKLQVLVESCYDPFGAIPVWEGELIPVLWEVAREVGELREKVKELLERGVNKREILARCMEKYPVSEEAGEWIIDQIRKVREENLPIPGRKVVVERGEGFVVIHACLGSLVNQTLALVLGSLITARLGESVRVKSDPYRIAFISSNERLAEVLLDSLRSLRPEHLPHLLTVALKQAPMLHWRLVNVAKRFGAIKRDADLRQISIRRLLIHFTGTPVFREAVREAMTEKLDMERTKEVISSLREGRIQLEVVERVEPSSLAWPILNEFVGREILAPERAKREILKVVKDRLERTVVNLFCLNCYSPSPPTRIRGLPEKIICRKCGATFVTAIFHLPKEAMSLLKKNARGEKLTRDEGREVERYRLAAALVQEYGRRALLAMAGRGVGPRTAARILRSSYPIEEDFYHEVLKAELLYARTRRFWD